MTQKKLGRYDLIRVLGKGAMGLVYEGRDPNLDRRVAIKTIKVENLSEEAAAEYEARFRTEARSAARLQHPNIVSVYDSDRDGDIAFLVMEFIQGEDLKHHLDKGKRHTLDQTLAIMRDLLSALDYAHRAKIVHRDIKPANLLIEADGRVKLTDFGVARIQDSGDSTRTQGSMVGTLKYMSPEQVQGQPVDARSDLFAAGVVLYQLLTGQRPFDGDSDFAIIQRIVAQNATAPTLINPGLPPAIDLVVARALAKSRDQRYPTAAEFDIALQACVGQGFDPTTVAPPPASGTGRVSTWTGTVRAGESLMDTQSGLGTSISVVTQELELVYWKDIKDSTDAEDLQGFLNRFPQGVYADLARRRMRKLGFAAGDDMSSGSRGGTGTGTSGGTRTGTAIGTPATPLAATAEANEKTEGSRHGGTSAPAGAAAPQPGPVATPPASAADAAGPVLPAPATPIPAPLPAALAAGLPAAAAPLEVDDAWKELAKVARELPVVATAGVGPTSAAAMPPVAPPPAADADQRPEDTTSPTLGNDSPVAPPSRRLVWALAGIAVLAAAGFGLSRMSASGDPALAPAALPASAPAVAGTPAMAASDAVAVTPATAASATMDAASSPGVQAAAARTAMPAAAASSSARKAPVVDKSKPAVTEPAAAAVAAQASPKPPPNATHQDSTPAPRTAAPTARGEPAASPAQQSASGGPRQACEDRSFIAFQNCMSEQCAKPAFANHPLCVERRGMEQRRKESAQSNR